MSRGYRQEICAAVTQLKPRSLLLIGAEAGEIAADYVAGHDECHRVYLEVDSDLPAALSNIGRVELALVTEIVPQLDKRTAGVVLSRLRDLCAERLLLVVPMGSGDQWRVEELFAYGLHRAGSYEEPRPVQVYGFDLHDYKTTPDWLNNRYWAHPELFGKFRW